MKFSDQILLRYCIIVLQKLSFFKKNSFVPPLKTLEQNEKIQTILDKIFWKFATDFV